MLVVVMGIILYFAIFARGKKTETITTRSFTTPKSATGPNLMLIRKRLKRSLKVADNLKSRIQQCPSTMSRHDRLSFVMRANLSHLRMAFVDPTYRMLFKVVEGSFREFFSFKSVKRCSIWIFHSRSYTHLQIHIIFFARVLKDK